jgi:hypothetical protein
MADLAVESNTTQNLPSTSHVVISGQQAQITAEIRVVEQPQNPISTSQISTSSITQPDEGDRSIINNRPTAQNPSSNNDIDEPELKKIKLSDDSEKKSSTTTPKKSKEIVEKLENRLGGILCCAVCLDLPKTAMYQVITTTDTFLILWVFFISKPVSIIIIMISLLFSLKRLQNLMQIEYL